MAAASSSGVGLSEWVRRSLNQAVEGRDVVTLSRRIASSVLHDLLPEMERMLSERVGASPDLMFAAPIQTGPRPWDPQCYSADLHRQGAVCNECGGSFRAER